MHHVLFGVYRKPGLTTEEFVAHYREVHVHIAARLPKLRRYEIFPVVPGPEADAGAPDAFVVMMFDSVEDFELALTTPEMAEAVEDNLAFIERSDAYTVDHIPVVTD